MNSLAIKNRSLAGINRIKGINAAYVPSIPNIDEMVLEKEAKKDSGVELDAGAGEEYMGFSKQQFWTMLGVVALAIAAIYALFKFKVIKV